MWWDNVEDERVKKEKEMVKTWDRMVTKLKDNFLPTNYMIFLFRKLKSQRQMELTMQEFNEELY